MNENKISVSEYLENTELLELNYTPYEVKNNIVNVVLDKVINKDNWYEIDSVLLNRISTQIFIESITNLDLSIVDEVGLDGYDQLCFANELNALLDIIMEEYERFEDMLDARLEDIYRERTSTASVLISFKKSLTEFIKNKQGDVIDYVKGIDTKALASEIGGWINNAIKRENKE